MAMGQRFDQLRAIDGKWQRDADGTARISPRHNPRRKTVCVVEYYQAHHVRELDINRRDDRKSSRRDNGPGTPYTVVKIDASANAVNVTPYGAQTINGSASAYAITTQWQTETFFSNGSNWVIIWT